MTVTANFSNGRLTIASDNGSDSVFVTADKAGRILLNGGAIPIEGTVVPTIANTNRVFMLGFEGNDSLSFGDSFGRLQESTLLGFAGNDTLVGRSGSDFIDGGSENDFLVGRDGADRLFGADGSDTIFGGEGADHLQGGKGNDQLFGGAGDDLTVWEAGDGSDLIEGNDGVDTVEVRGSTGADTIGVIAAGDRVRVVDGTGGLLLDIGTTEIVRFNGGAGNDIVITAGDLAPLVRLEIDAGDGNDTVFGGTGNDTVVGGTGDDDIFGEGGDDRMIWRAGDGNDELRGGSGIDTVEIRGGSGADSFAISTLGGLIRVDGTAPAAFRLDISSTEKLVIDAGGGNDLVSVTGGLETVASLTVDGGAGNDTVGGADGADLLLGGAGNDALSGLSDSDTLDGGLGADTMQGGFGADVYIVDDVGDRVIEVANGGRDLVKSTVSFTLGTSVDNLMLLGSEDLTGIGNSGRNVMTGNDGDNLLDGKAAADKMAGGKGDDTYVVDNDRDVVTEAADSGVDTVRSSVSLTLSAHVENLVLTGTGKINGTGNGQDNQLTGNGGSNALDGGDGADTLVGGGGNDSLTGGEGGDRFAFSLAASAGADVILDFDRTADRLSFSDLLDGGTPGLDLDDLNAAISGVTDGGIGGDVTVAFANGARLVFQGLGTGAVDSIDDLVADPATQIIL